MVRLSAQGGNRNLDINPLTVFAFFVSRCRQNLHIILSLSSISYSFRRWLSLYPSLLNHCTVDWVEVRDFIFWYHCTAVVTKLLSQWTFITFKNFLVRITRETGSKCLHKLELKHVYSVQTYIFIFSITLSKYIRKQKQTKKFKCTF